MEGEGGGGKGERGREGERESKINVGEIYFIEHHCWLHTCTTLYYDIMCAQSLLVHCYGCCQHYCMLMLTNHHNIGGQAEYSSQEVKIYDSGCLNLTYHTQLQAAHHD